MIPMPTADEPVTVVQADCMDALRQLPDACVDAIITDPPYSSGGLFRGDRAASTESKYVCDHEVKNFHPPFTGDNRDQRTYLLWAELWLRECQRIAKPGAPVCVFTDWRQMPVTSDALQVAGFVWRGVIVWDKTEGARPTAGRFKQQAEFIVWGSNGAMPFDSTDDCLNGVFRYAPFRGKQHIAGKPEGLMRELVAICPKGGIVLDPFAGSATTGSAAIAEGRLAILVEKDATYADVSRRRVADAMGRGKGSLFTEAV